MFSANFMPNPDSYKQYFDELRQKILDSIIVAGLIAGLPLILHICYRDFRFGGITWKTGIQVGTYLLIFVIQWLRNRVPYQFRAGIILLLLTTSACIGLYQAGIYSFAPITLFACIVITGILLGHREAVVFLLLIVTAYSLIGLQFINGNWKYPYPASEYWNTPLVWIGWVTSIATYSVITVICLDLVYRYLKEKILESEQFKQELKQQNALLQQRTLDLEQTKKKLEKADLVKNEFLGLISHELRTPINPIIGMVGLVEQTIGDQPENLERLGLIRVSAERLQHAVDHILEIASMDDGSVTCCRVWSTLDSIINPLMVFHEPIVAERGLYFFQNRVPDTEEFEMDPNKIRSILDQLLSNAIRFSKKGTVALVTTIHETEDPQMKIIRFEVKDEGIGIAEPYVASIQRLFSRLDGGLSQHFQGMGLGLAIVARLAAITGAEVQFVSTEGKGTSVTVEIRAHVRSKTVYCPSQEIQEGKFLRPIHLLIADDDLINRVYAQQLIKLMGGEMTIAVDGEAAVAQCLDGQFDVILMDLSMPKLDGIEATRQIRKIPHCIQTPIVGLTAHYGPDIENQCRQAGMDGLISKPMNAAKIIQTFKSLNIL